MAGTATSTGAEYAGLSRSAAWESQDLERTGLALRTRWQWLSRTNNRRAWSGLGLQFTKEERDFFFASTSTIVGNGQRTRFWEDRWIDGRSISEITPHLYACVPKRRRKARTVADGLQAHQWATDIQGTIGIQEIGEYLLTWQRIEQITLTDEPDSMRWLWSVSGTYTAHSAYLAMFQGSTSCHAWKLTWKSWAPPRVRFFHWLASLDRCWTAECLARRGLPHPPRCPLCDQDPETILHLFLGCPLSRQVWHDILSWLRLTCQVPSTEASLVDWWRTARQRTLKPMRKGLASATLVIPWMIWKHCNDCVFNNARPSANGMVAGIKDEAALWARAGALGLRAILPQTWDVH